MKLRLAGPDDAAKLSLIGAASFLETFANDHPGDAVVAFTSDAHSVASWQAALALPDSDAWLVEEAAGSPIGYVMLVTATLPGTTSADAQIQRIYLLSKWQGTGLGKALLDAAEARARERGAARLVLSVYTKNVRAIAFYQRQGFTTIGTARFPGFDEAFSDYVMAKPLA